MSQDTLHPASQKESNEQELKVAVQRSRYIAWLVLASYYITLGLAYLLDVPADARTFYVWVYGIGSIFPLSVTVGLYFSYSSVWRALLPIFAVAPVLTETAYFHPLMGSTIWWASLVVGYASMIYFMRDEYRIAIGLVAFVGIVGLLIAIFHPKLARLPGNAVSHGYIRYAIIQGAMISAAIIGVILNNQLRRIVISREEKLNQALKAQEETLRQLVAQRAEAERRRQESEAALAEVSRLREEERQRAQREAFFMRYEQLMRAGYELSREGFAQKLLDALSEDLGMLGGVWYEHDGEIWRVIAAYAFPQKVGTEVKGGILRTVQLLKKPYILSPLPDGVRIPPTALLQAKPIAALYLPFYSTVTDEVVSVAELLLHQIPEAHSLHLIEGLLPRIGTYWWGRHSTPGINN